MQLGFENLRNRERKEGGDAKSKRDIDEGRSAPKVHKFAIFLRNLDVPVRP